MKLGDKARATLLKCGRIVADYYGYELATVGERADGDRRFFDRMRQRRNLGFRKYDEVSCFLYGHWPPGAEWPSSENTFGPPDVEDVQTFMRALPKKRRLLAPHVPTNGRKKNVRKQFLETPPVAESVE